MLTNKLLSTGHLVKCFSWIFTWKPLLQVPKLLPLKMSKSQQRKHLLTNLTSMDVEWRPRPPDTVVHHLQHSQWPSMGGRTEVLGCARREQGTALCSHGLRPSHSTLGPRAVPVLGWALPFTCSIVFFPGHRFYNKIKWGRYSGPGMSSRKPL